MSEKCESCTCEKTEEAKSPEILIQFDMNNMTEYQLEKLHEAEKCLMEAGVSFDTGAGFGARDWNFDWSLKGPVKVVLLKQSGE